MPLEIGPWQLDGRVFLAPMAGITDRPFRDLCRRYGAAWAVTEMTSANPALRETRKSRQRLCIAGEAAPRVVQIAGSEPEQMAAAARHAVTLGAQVVDINMGCPAKKVLGKAAGSALLREEGKVAAILEAVTAAVEVPVTLKIRTGWDRDRRNGVRIARLAEAAGIAALAVHGRTRACRFSGRAEHDTLAAIRQAVSLPLIANGDIDGPEQARRVLEHTGADAVMIGRAVQGRPWLLREIDHFLRHGRVPAPLPPEARLEVMLGHVRSMHAFYGPVQGVRIARKHIGWYLQHLPVPRTWRVRINETEDPGRQLELLAGLGEIAGGRMAA